MGEQMLFIY